MTTLALRGVGVMLPGPADSRGYLDTHEELWNVAQQGICCLRQRNYYDLPLQVFGIVEGFCPATYLDMPEKYLAKYSRAAILALASFKSALNDSGLTASDLCGSRTLILFCSVQHAIGHTERYYDTWNKKGCAGLKLDYLIGGMPTSIPNLLCNTFGISCKALSINGGCSVTAQGFEIANMMFALGEIDRAVIIGFDTALEKLILSCAVNKNKMGIALGAATDNPEAIRVHDRDSIGQAIGEGAITFILDANENIQAHDRMTFTARTYTERTSGDSPMAPGDGSNYCVGIDHLLRAANITLDDIAFINDIGEGHPFVQQFSYDFLQKVRQEQCYDHTLLVTNQEACFGHIGGVSGGVKIVTSLLMLQNNFICPCAGCVNPPEHLPITPIVGAGIPRSSMVHALVLSGGAGGDATVVLLSKTNRNNESRETR